MACSPRTEGSEQAADRQAEERLSMAVPASGLPRRRSSSTDVDEARSRKCDGADRCLAHQSRRSSARSGFSCRTRTGADARRFGCRDVSSNVDHPLTTRAGADPTRAAVLVITSGPWPCRVPTPRACIKEAEASHRAASRRGQGSSRRLPRRPQGARPTSSSATGPTSASWTGCLRRSRTYDNGGREVGAALLEAFLKADCEDGGVDEIHVVYTRFKSMVTQEPTVIRLLPLEVVEERGAASEVDELLPLYEFEPESEPRCLTHCSRSYIRVPHLRTPCCRPQLPSSRPASRR